jgi:hypothetical protein
MAFLRGLIVSAGFVVVLAASSVDAAQLYWTDGAGINRANIDGTSPQLLVPRTGVWIHSFTFDPDHQKLYWMESGSDNLYSMRAANLDGSGYQTLLSGIQTQQAIAYRSADQMIYWGAGVGGGVQRTSIDGATTELAFPTLSVDLNRFFIDEAGGKLYQLDLDNRVINRFNLDGTQYEEVLGTNPPSHEEPRSMAFDLAAGQLYWTEYTGVHRANLDGSNDQLLFDPAFDTYNAGLAVDPATGQLYISSVQPAATIYRVNLDGTNPQAIIVGNDTIENLLLIEAVPEPSTVAMLLAAVPVGYFVSRRRRS